MTSSDLGVEKPGPSVRTQSQEVKEEEGKTPGWFDNPAPLPGSGPADKHHRNKNNTSLSGSPGSIYFVKAVSVPSSAVRATESSCSSSRACTSSWR